MPDDEARELKEAVDRVVESTSGKKLVVAGPGAGKTFLFQKLLEAQGGARDGRLVITFVNNLKDDLEASLGNQAQVFTLHGYCQSLLHKEQHVRDGLSANFVCWPGLRSIFKQDWEWLEGTNAPEFVRLMRELTLSEEEYTFYQSRSAYYDAVDFDDSVYRIHRALTKDPDKIPGYDLVLIDEFQDFNTMEAGVVALLGNNPIVIAGDDDQVLYSTLRQADWDHIRGHHNDGHYEVFYLPFCMRCPKVIVEAVASILAKAGGIGALQGRIAKPYRYCEMKKGADSRANPHIHFVRASVQRLQANYFGRYVEELYRSIPEDHAEEAKNSGEPLLLVIGGKPYMPQIETHLLEAGLLEIVQQEDRIDRDEALRILATNPRSNLGWRIILACGENNVARERIVSAAERGCGLFDVFPEAERDAILAEAAAKAQEPQPPEAGERAAPLIKLTTYEGSKGLSAQYVVLVGVHERELPRDATNIKDLEICKFVVGLTRTKKRCTILTAGRFGNAPKQPSAFLSWIAAASYKRIFVNAEYWK